MSFDIDTSRLVESLRREYVANLGKLAGLPAYGSYSLDGLSVSVGDVRKSLTDRQKDIEQTLAGLGSPIGTLGVPFQAAERLTG